jgi:Leucine-rich repeat (LRR) protein
LKFKWSREVATDWQLSGISRLTHLKCLALEGMMLSDWLPALMPLTQLTSLDIAALNAYTDYLQHLPASLVRLQLLDVEMDSLYPQQSAAVQVAPEGALYLSHLTRLTQLQIAISCTDAGNISAQLPAQLLELDAWCNGPGVVPLLGVPALQKLQRLVLTECKEQRTNSLKLSLLSALTSLEVTSTFADAQEMAAVWGQLPQLRSLELNAESAEDVPAAGLQELQQLLVKIGEARSLRRLTLSFEADLGDDEGAPLKVFGGLTGLQQLRELRISAGEWRVNAGPFIWDPGAPMYDVDALHLTKLTQLTLLAIDTWPVGNVVAAALACNLTQLGWLELVRCDLTDGEPAALQAIGKLTQLQHLDLSCNRFKPLSFNDGLLHLTDLRALTQLQLSSRWGSGLSKRALDQFWSAVRGDPGK